MATILIKNGLVYDGSGDLPVKQDILVREERIARLGNFSKNQADTLIDAAGAIVCPGFVDINSASDHYLDVFTDSYQENLIQQGITTVIGGNCGASLAPLVGGSLASIRKWGDISKVNIDWHTVSELLSILEKRGVGVNFGTLVGHSTVRRSLVGEHSRDLTDRELETFKKTLAQAFQEGAFGFSTGLEYAHSKNVAHHEIVELVRSVAKHGRVYATHLKNYREGLERSLGETIVIAKRTGANVEVSHLQPLKDFHEEYARVKEMLERESAEIHINFDCYFSGLLAIPMYQFLPEWAKKGNLETMLEHVNSAHLKQELLHHFIKFSPADMYVCHAPSPLEFLIGKSLKEYALNNHLKTEEALLKLMKLSHLQIVFFHRLVDPGLLEDFLVSSSSLIASGEMRVPASSADLPVLAKTSEDRPTALDPKSKCNVKIFTDFISWVKKEGKISMEKAIAKITSQPAAKYGIKKRGFVREGYYADIVVLRDEKPENVILNGKIVLQEGNVSQVLAGHVLRAGN